MTRPPAPPTVATFHIGIEFDADADISLWLTTMTEMVNLCATEITVAFQGKIRLLTPVQSGQEVPLIDQPVRDRDDV